MATPAALSQAQVRKARLAQISEAILNSGLPIVDAHRQFWDLPAVPIGASGNGTGGGAPGYQDSVRRRRRWARCQLLIRPAPHQRQHHCHG